MKCSNPTVVYYDHRGTRVFRSFDIVNRNPDRYAHYLKKSMSLNCGRCLICRKRRALELAHRCVLHSSLYKENCFITLTWDPEHPEYHNNFDYSEIQKFKKKLRNEYRSAYCDIQTRKLKFHYWKKIEIFNVHEYGKKGKKHWHLIVFNHDFKDKILYTENNGIKIFKSQRLRELWKYGYNTVGDVSIASAMYQAQYMEKDFKNGYVTTKKKSHSKHSGLGKPYFMEHYEQILLLGYIPINGKKMPIPRYYERLAKRHYAHYYEPSLFEDNRTRKAPFRKFGRKDQPSRRLADLYLHYRDVKDSFIKKLSEQWDQVVLEYLTSDKQPDFIKSGENQLYDLKRKIINDNF